MVDWSTYSDHHGSTPPFHSTPVTARHPRPLLRRHLISISSRRPQGVRRNVTPRRAARAHVARRLPLPPLAPPPHPASRRRSRARGRRRCASARRTSPHHLTSPPRLAFLTRMLRCVSTTPPPVPALPSMSRLGSFLSPPAARPLSSSPPPAESGRAPTRRPLAFPSPFSLSCGRGGWSGAVVALGSRRKGGQKKNSAFSLWPAVRPSLAR